MGDVLGLPGAVTVRSGCSYRDLETLAFFVLCVNFCPEE